MSKHLAIYILKVSINIKPKSKAFFFRYVSDTQDRIKARFFLNIFG